jgi:hypothetical protein
VFCTPSVQVPQLTVEEKLQQRELFLRFGMRKYSIPYLLFLSETKAYTQLLSISSDLHLRHDPLEV